MSKLSIGQHGIQVETHEKTNVMSSFHTMAFVVLPLCTLLILVGHDNWAKWLGAIGFISLLLIWIVIYTTHSIKKPDLLQSESYRIERHKIEAGMIENKTENLQRFEIETNKTNLLEVIPDNQEGDNNVS